MTKEEIIRNLKYTMEKHKNDIVPTFGTDISLMCKDILDYLEQEPKWTPVNDRLPEDGQNVLFCDIDDKIMIGYHVKGRPNTHFSQDGTYDDMKNVRAWMPLPEPYEAESEDKDADSN